MNSSSKTHKNSTVSASGEMAVSDYYDDQFSRDLNDFLHSVNMQINRGDSFENILQHLVDGVRTLFNFEIVTCFILDPQKIELTVTNISMEKSKLRVVEGIIGFEIRHMKIPLFEGSQFSEVINGRKSLVLKDNLASMADYSPREEMKEVAKILMPVMGSLTTYRIPLIIENEVVGIFGASRKINNTQENNDLDLKTLEYIAPKVGLIVNKVVSDRMVRESEKRYRNLIELAPDPIIIIDTTGRILDANSALIDKTGFSKDEIIDIPFHQAPFLPPGTASQSMVLFGLLLQGKLESPYEVSWIAKDGTKLIWEIRITVIKENGVITAFQSIARDVTHRKALEQELQATNQQLLEKNIALKEMLQQLESEKSVMQNQMDENVNRLIVPLVKSLRSSSSESKKQSYELLLRRLNDIVSPFSNNLDSISNGLTSKELEICDMIRHGYPSKEIGRQLNISHRTVETHRNNIRKKLNLANRDINLQSYLKNL